MVETDLASVEHQLGVSLPEDYRSFVLSHPGGDIADYEVWDSAQRVIDANRDLRLNGPSPECHWSTDHIAIGESGCGDYYALDLSQGVSPVVLWNHETSAFESVAHSFAAWANRLSDGS